MKNFIIVSALLITAGFSSLIGIRSASADIGDMPTADALSYGQNAEGCYYTSDTQDIVYSKGFTLKDSNSCGQELVIANRSIYDNSVIGKWRQDIIDYLKSLVQ